MSVSTSRAAATTSTPTLLPLAAAGFVSSSRNSVFPARRLSVIACGSRGQTFKDFRTAVRQQAADFVILLVDSEGPLEGAVTSWAHLALRDKWRPPAITTEDQAHLMVQCMEAWFLADQDVLGHFYGRGFLPSSLPHRPDIEQVPRVELLDALRQASRRTQKRTYHKTKHGFAILGVIDPQKVRAASPRAGRLFDVLIREVNRVSQRRA